MAFTDLAADKVGRSVPAPGKGILGFAGAEETGRFPNQMLDLDYRRRALERRLKHIHEAQDEDLALLPAEAENAIACDPSINIETYLTARKNDIYHEAASQTRFARFELGNAFFRSSPRIAPLAGALAVWGLTADAIGIAALHGTSTPQGDLNEATVLNTQLSHLGRTPGNPALAICSKWATGHGKGAAGAWALNGALQSLESGDVPGNRNLDDVASELEACSMLLFPNCAVNVGRVDAASVTGFGFGQKGAQALLVHPRYLFAVLEGESEYVSYMERVRGGILRMGF